MLHINRGMVNNLDSSTIQRTFKLFINFILEGIISVIRILNCYKTVVFDRDQSLSLCMHLYVLIYNYLSNVLQG